MQAHMQMCVHVHMHLHVHLERSGDRRRLGGCGRALEVRRKLVSYGRELRANRRLGNCGSVRVGLDHGRGLDRSRVERCRHHHLGRCRRRRHCLGRCRHFGRRLHRLRGDRLGLGLVVFDEESAVGLDRVDGAGTPTDHEALGTRVGARVSKRAWLGDRLGLSRFVIDIAHTCIA